MRRQNSLSNAVEVVSELGWGIDRTERANYSSVSKSLEFARQRCCDQRLVKTWC